MATINATELSVQLMHAARKVFEDNGIYVHKGGDQLAIAVSALARCAYAVGLAGDREMEGLTCSLGLKGYAVDILSGGRLFTAPDVVEIEDAHKG